MMTVAVQVSETFRHRLCRLISALDKFFFKFCENMITFRLFLHHRPKVFLFLSLLLHFPEPSLFAWCLLRCCEHTRTTITESPQVSRAALCSAIVYAAKFRPLFHSPSPLLLESFNLPNDRHNNDQKYARSYCTWPSLPGTRHIS